MKRHVKVLRLLAAIVAALVLSITPAYPRPASALQGIEEVADRVWPAVVQLGPLVEVTDRRGQKKLSYFGWGSGTIVHPNGFILTNHHVVDVASLEEQVGGRSDVRVLEGLLAVFITKDVDSPPVPSYIAEVKADAENLDLAVVQITQDLSGRPVDGESLRLPFVPLGDSTALKLGQKVHVLGYPAVGGETITFTSGDISGFTYEAGVDGRAWIKTSASISGGNSGGTAIDDAGKLIGVPTQAGRGQASPEDVVDCRPVRDTNGDGRLDDNDVCVPLGGFINALRPVDLAKALISQATRGLSPNTTPERSPTRNATRSPTGTVDVTPTPSASGATSVSRMIFSNGVSEDGSPVSVIQSLPSGSRDLVVFFDYSGFETGVPWQPRMFVNGEEWVDAWVSTNWDAEANGNAGVWWFGWLDAELPDGTYKFQVDYDGRSVSDGTIEVGGTESDEPAFSNVTFSGGGEEGRVLPAGIDTIEASFEAANIDDGDEWWDTWYIRDANGRWETVAQPASYTWEGGSEGTATLDTNEELESGLYRVELYTGDPDDADNLAATSDVYLTGGTNGNNTSGFGPITFAEDIDEDGQPVSPGTAFQGGLEQLYVFSDYTGMEDGLDYNITWLLDDEVIIDQDNQWQLGESGTWNDWIYMTSSDPLPSGKYEARLSIRGEEVQSASATVGDGQDNGPTPMPTVNPDDAVYISGEITDATTGRPIPEAVIAVLVEGVTWSDYADREDQIYDLAVTDRRGEFQLQFPLQRGSTYSIGVFAEGYQSDLADGVTIEQDWTEEVSVEIALQRE